MNELQPLVSIVLPTYNGSNFIRLSIDSCLNQTFKNFELIIVDDGSTDETHRIIESYQDRRIKCIRHRKNKGLPVALNTGFANASGDFLTWTSDDNQYLPTAIEEMVSFLEENPGVDLVYADFLVRNLETGQQKELRRMPDVLDLGRVDGVGACFLYTRRVYESLGGYDPRFRLVEDYEFWIRVCKKFKAKHLPRVLYVYGEHSKSLTSTKYVGIFLFDRTCKYRHGYISLSELRELLSKSYLPTYEVESSFNDLYYRFLIYFRNIVTVSPVSLTLSLLLLLFLVQLSASDLLKFCLKQIRISP